MFKKQSGVWFGSYRETLVDVHTACRIRTMNDESRVTGASEEKWIGQTMLENQLHIFQCKH